MDNSEGAGTPAPTEQGAGGVPAANRSRMNCYCPRCEVITLCLDGRTEICPGCRGQMQEPPSPQIRAEVSEMLENILRMPNIREGILNYVPPARHWDMSRYVSGYHGGDGDIPEIPTVQVTAADVSSALQCPICLEDFVCGEEISKTECSHCFHRGCINQWLRQNRTCPKCRASLEMMGEQSD